MNKYLFRLDMAKDNEPFLSLRQETGIDHVYSGTPIKIGPGWLPDYCEIMVNEENSTCCITIIELEATDIVARAACRKYLPEKSSEIINAVVLFLKNVIAQCRSTADPRFNAFEILYKYLAGNITISVHTAGALRSSANFIEEFPLIDQSEEPVILANNETVSCGEFKFDGTRRLTRIESEGLRRTVRITHAVIIGRDHSGSTMKSWRGSRNKPLDEYIFKRKDKFPTLNELLYANTIHGLNVNCVKINDELKLLWADVNKSAFTSIQIKNIIEQYYPFAIGFKEHELMQVVFQKARQIISHASI